jgi:hypothetical protein
MKERPYPYSAIEALTRDAEELRAECWGLSEGHERALVRQQAERVETARTRYEAQAESLDRLPEFWETVYGEGPGFVALLSGMRRDGRLVNPQTAYFGHPARTIQAVDWVRHAAAEDREVYMCGHLVTERRRRKETAATLASLYVDLDHADLTAPVPPPSIVVESSPGRLQCYWRLDEPIAPEIGETLNRRLAHALWADRTGWDLTQLLRIPGTRNHKYPDNPTVALVTLTDRRHTMQALLDALPLASPPSARSVRKPSASQRLLRTEEMRPSLLSDSLTASARSIYMGQRVKRTPDGRVDRSAALVQMARILYGAGVPPECIPAILAERDETLGWHKYTDRQDAWRQYERITDLVEHSPRKRS